MRFFTHRPLQSSEFREACSRWISGESLPGIDSAEVLRLFNHAPDGKLIQHMSPFRFAAEGNWGFIHAVGDEAAQLLGRFSAAVAKLPPPSPWLAPPQLRELEVSIAAGAERHYWTPDLIVCRDAHEHAVWKDASAEDRVSHVRSVVERGLQRQAKLLAFDVEIPQVQVTEVARERPTQKLPNTKANAYVRLASVAFRAPVELVGHWAAGGLINRGYGGIVAVQ